MRRTPVITLLAGLALAAVLVTMSSLASSPKPQPAALQASPTPAPSPSPSEKPKVNATWAGEVDGGGATIAISVHDGVAVAYLCDGKKAEAWLQGTAADGKLTLTGKDGSTLTGTFGGGKATGVVTAAGKQWRFTAPAAAPPSGLYRSAEVVTSAKVVCGWIVLADGRQVGVCTTDGQPAAAPKLDVAAAKPLDPKDFS